MLQANAKVFLTFKNAFHQNGERFTVLSTVTSAPPGAASVLSYCLCVLAKVTIKKKNVLPLQILFILKMEGKNEASVVLLQGFMTRILERSSETYEGP